MITRDEIERDFWQIIHQQAERFADKVAVRTKDRSITFRDLHQCADRIAATISSITASNGKAIGLFSNEGIKISCAMAGVLKSQNFVVPLDPTFPKPRLQYLINDAQIGILLCDRENIALAEQIKSENITIINIDLLDVSEEIPSPEIEADPHRIIQIIYTAGSTGESKGVVEDYRFLARNIAHKINIHKITDQDRILVFNSFSFATPHSYLFTCLLTGATFYHYNLKEHGFVDLNKWIRDECITFYHSTPTVYRSFVSTLKEEDIFPSMRVLQIGGEKRTRQDVASFRKHFLPTCVFGVGFASTETQVVAYHPYKNDLEFSSDILPAGFPLKDVEVMIWDEQGNPLPQGEAGEIVIKGDALAQGYWQQPELTRQKFIEDKHNSAFSLFRTGDLGKILPDGQLMHLGRLDDLVKIKGVRVELASVEGHILAYPGIAQASVRAIEDLKGNLKLVGYVVPESGSNISLSDLRKFLVDRMPFQMVPHYFLTLDALPMLPSGKIDRSALPDPSFHRPELPYPHVPPESRLELTLVEIWEENLGIQGIGVQDHYFELGGDSLAAVMLFVQIEKILGKKLPISVLLNHPTIRKLSELISSQAADEYWDIVVPLQSQGEGAPVFFIPGKGGYPIRFQYLAHKITRRNPLFAFQIWGGGKRQRFFDTIEETASYYLSEIRKIFPTGPYHFCGESLGGTIAYEMAQQLAKNGEQVPVLVMFDTYGPEQKGKLQFPDSSATKIPYYAMLINKHLQILTRSDLSGKISYIRYYWNLFLNNIRNLQQKYVQRIESKETEDIFAQIKRIEQVSTAASKRYRPKPYHGRVILFRAQRNPSSIDPTNGWDKVELGELVIHNLDCYHGNILFDPAVSQVATLLDAYLAEK